MHIPTRFLTTAAPAAMLAFAAFPAVAWADPTPECNIPDPLASTSTECGVNASVFDPILLRVAVDATAVGGDSKAYGDASIAVGYRSFAQGEKATAIGSRSSAAQATSTAIGADSVAFDNSVALGYGSTTLSNAGGAPLPRANTVSVGSAYAAGAAGIFQRQITNVAAGTEAFDAVNKAQLDAAIAAGNPYVAITSGGSDAFASSTWTIAIGPDSEAYYADGIAMGAGAKAGGEYATAIGTGAKAGVYTLPDGISTVSGNFGATAIGTSASAGMVRSTAIGWLSQANATGSVALGAGSIADRANSVSVGNGSLSRQIVNVAAGTQATDAVNKAQLDVVDAKATAAQATANAALASANGGAGSAAGAQMTADAALANAAAAQTTANAAQTTANGAQTTALAAQATAQTSLLRGDTAGASIASALGGGAAFNQATGAVSAPSYSVSGTTYRDVGSAIGALDSKLGVLNDRVDALSLGNDRRFREATGGIVTAMAMGGTMIVPDSTVSVSFNLATYQGEQGFSGAAVVRLTPRVYVSGGFAGSTVKGTTGGRVGVAFGF